MRFHCNFLFFFGGKKFFKLSSKWNILKMAEKCFHRTNEKKNETMTCSTNTWVNAHKAWAKECGKDSELEKESDRVD